MHGRSEAALHRWDLAGDDETSEELLRQPELTVHAVGVLNTMLEASQESVTVRTTAAAITELRANFAAPGHMDVVLVVDGAGARLELDEPWARCSASAEPATRLLALWGRRSSARPIAWNTEDAAAGPLAAFLWAGASPPRPPCPKPASRRPRRRAGWPGWSRTSNAVTGPSWRETPGSTGGS